MQPLPRRDLREPAFRRYEKLLARATLESFITNPFDGQSATTFIARWHDAVRGFKLYKYSSALVPHTYNFSVNVKLTELSNGAVQVSNPMADMLAYRRSSGGGGVYKDVTTDAGAGAGAAQTQSTPTNLSISNPDHLPIIQQLILDLETGVKTGLYEILYSSQAELESLWTLCDNRGVGGSILRPGVYLLEDLS